MNKYGFRIRTQRGMVVDSLQVQARDRDEAEGKIRQVYHQCEIIECRELVAAMKKEGLALDDVIALINQQPDR